MKTQEERKRWATLYVVERFQGLLVIPVPGGPEPKALKAAANAWVRVITRSLGNVWLAGDDERLRIGFDRVEEQATWWPTVGAVIAAMPPRKPGLGLPMPPVSDDERNALQGEIKDFVDQLCAGVAFPELPKDDHAARMRLLSKQAQELQAGVHD